jgi:hypothetical protein
MDYTSYTKQPKSMPQPIPSAEFFVVRSSHQALTIGFLTGARQVDFRANPD